MFRNSPGTSKHCTMPSSTKTTTTKNRMTTTNISSPLHCLFMLYINLSLSYLIFRLQTKRHLGGLIECWPLSILLVIHDKQLSVDNSGFGVIPSTRSQQVLIKILELMTYAKYSPHKLPTSARKSLKILGHGNKQGKSNQLCNKNVIKQDLMPNHLQRQQSKLENPSNPYNSYVGQLVSCPCFFNDCDSKTLTGIHAVNSLWCHMLPTYCTWLSHKI